MPKIPALGRQKQEDLKFEVKPYLKKGWGWRIKTGNT
jgi:hypothetical protein